MSDDYEVGYGRPPKKNQFQAGRSGNVNGRPKKPLAGAVDPAEVIDQPVAVRVGHLEKTMQPKEVALRILLKKAMAGDRRAMVRLLDHLLKYGALGSLAKKTTGGGVVTLDTSQMPFGANAIWNGTDHGRTLWHQEKLHRPPAGTRSPRIFGNAKRRTGQDRQRDWISGSDTGETDMTRKTKPPTPKTTAGPGRPKGARNVRTIVNLIAKELVLIRDASGQRMVTVAEAVLLKLQQLAMKGDIEADKHIDRLRDQIMPEPAADAGILLVPAPISCEEWRRRAEIANQFAQPPIMPPGQNSMQSSPKAGDKPVKQASIKRPPSQFPRGPDMRGRLIR